MHKDIHEAYNNYCVDQNAGRSELASYTALKSACEKHDFDILTLFRSNGVTLEGAGKAVVTGAYGGPYALEVFDFASVLPSSITDGVTVHVFDAGKHFDLMPGVLVVDHRQAA